MSDHAYAGRTLAEIKETAEKATPGQWIYMPNRIHGVESHCIGVEESFVCVASTGDIGDKEYDKQSIVDAEFIATANPATVLALAARIEELEAELHRVTTEPPTGAAPCARLCEHTAFKSRHEQDKRAIAEREQQLSAALRLVAEVRHAIGDDGKRMPQEFVEYMKEMAKNAARYQWLRSNALYSYRNGPGLYWYLPRYYDPGEPAERLDKDIDGAMSAAAMKTNWPHPDGFAGGLTERGE